MLEEKRFFETDFPKADGEKTGKSPPDTPGDDHKPGSRARVEDASHLRWFLIQADGFSQQRSGFQANAVRRPGLEAMVSTKVYTVRTACSPVGGTVVCRRADVRKNVCPLGKGSEYRTGAKSPEVIGQSSGRFIFQADCNRRGGDVLRSRVVACDNDAWMDETSPGKRCSIETGRFVTYLRICH